MELNRRDFLRLSGGGLCTLLASGVFLPKWRSKEVLTPAKAEIAMLYDSSKCVGCRACQMACKRWNGLPPESTDKEALYESPRDLSEKTWTLIKLRRAQGDKGLFHKYQCWHCTDAACVAVCPTGALYKHELGFTAFDAEKCNGCGYCVQFCPFGVPHLQVESLLTGAAKATKCTFCQDRVIVGQAPACVESCPTGALRWGQRDELIAEAKERLATLQREGYAKANLYGEKEAGGLHALSILLDDPTAYGLPATVQTPSLAHIWQEIIQPLGTMSMGVVALGLALNVLIAGRTLKSEE
ncbi:MAG: 4Fe-4S dicluster domain-containing protein [Anaerolineae bacterium]